MTLRPTTALLLALLAGNGMAASFDCSKASSFAEKSICADGYLSTVDNVLATSYKKALTAAADPQALRQSQREWLAQRDQCTTQQCLDKALGARIQVLDHYAADEQAKAYDAEQRVQAQQREAQRQAQDALAAQRVDQARAAAEQQPRPHALAPAAPLQPRYQAPAPAAQPAAAQTLWQWFFGGPGWKYTLLIGACITAFTLRRHHAQVATLYTDYTDAAITNLLPAAGVIIGALCRWLELPAVLVYSAGVTGFALAILYAVYASIRSNRGALNTVMVIVTKLTLISVFYVLIGLLIASLFVNTRRQGESQARADARNRREKRATRAQIAGLTLAYTALTAWLCRRPMFTSLADCLEFDTTPLLT
ncbi:lysozyme inhibitor LprI family protein [Pseudomonas silvicola]|nr:lysozyme inhibitor LprI family protein [Pseudomonas silvicola]